jgi:hypothetical protein
MYDTNPSDLIYAKCLIFSREVVIGTEYIIEEIKVDGYARNRGQAVRPVYSVPAP